MTSIAESRVAGPGSAGYPPGRLRTALLLALLGGGAALTPAPWRVLWAAVPAAVAELVRQVGYSGERLEGIQHTLLDNARLRREALPHVLPTLLFVWMAALIAAGRKLAARGAGELHWPNLAPARLLEWRLPDGALWTFLAGLGLLVGPWTAWAPTAWTLLLNSGLGFCVQGIAVVESLLLARGVPPSIIVLTMVFVFAFALPVFVLATVAVGLSDVWLDYRRLEPAEDGTRI